MRLARLALLLAAALTAGCAASPRPPSDRSVCVGLFQQYDRVARFFPPGAEARRGRRFDPELRRLGVLLIENDCQTRSRDLGGLDAVARDRDGRPIAESGAPLGRAVSVHAGAVTSDADAGRAVAFFTGLGLRATSIGDPRLGRRVFVGPVITEGGLAELLALAAEAGFVAPYPSQFWRF